MEKLRSAASASCSCDRSMVIASTVLSMWMVINVALNFWNKYVLSPEGGPKGGLGFSFPVFYSTFHMARAAVRPTPARAAGHHPSPSPLRSPPSAARA